MSIGTINDFSLITDFDAHLFREGTHFSIYEKLGAHLITIVNGIDGAYFAVCAPNAKYVSVIGEFNHWDPGANPLVMRHPEAGIWEGFVPGVKKGAFYKYHISSKFHNYSTNKCDPVAFYCETPPGTASRVYSLEYEWNDGKWMRGRSRFNGLRSPISIYEVHIGSWRRVPKENNRPLTYRELAHQLAEYVNDMGFTHVEFMPVTEHPFYGSWGYQTTGYFAPTSRYGAPDDFMYLVDYLHQNGIGVIIDWVPSHFASDGFGLVYFDGTHLYEHADSRQGFHPEWKSYIFNYGRNEVRNFLISSAAFWLDKYHIDGLRVDAVASLLYLDYARQNGEWIPNEYGGRENLSAVSFIKNLNEFLYSKFPDVQIIAEESTAWAQVSRPVYSGGLGFGMKWNMGWMHDTLEYITKNPFHRKHHHNSLTFSIWYAFYENFILPLSHDEVVHGKGSLYWKMPGDEWQKYANLRVLFGYMWTHPGKKLLFMGGEFAQWKEWYHETSLDWHILQYPNHLGVQKWVRALNNLYKSSPALYELDFENAGFSWIDWNDWQNSVITYLRKAKNAGDAMVIACNFTPVARQGYRIGVPAGGAWKEILNSDSKEYYGSGSGNPEPIAAQPIPWNGMSDSISVSLPPLSALIFRMVEEKASPAQEEDRAVEAETETGEYEPKTASEEAKPEDTEPEEAKPEETKPGETKPEEAT